MDFIILAVLIAEVLLLSGVENRLTGTRITPFGVLAFPYLAVVLLAFISAPVLDFVPLDTSSLMVWVCGLFLVWLMGYLVILIFPSAQISRDIASRLLSDFPGEASGQRIAKLLGVIVIPLLVLGIVQSVRAVGGWWNIGSREFREVQGHGLSAHALLLAEPLFILLMGTAKKRNKFQIILAVILMAFFLVDQVKGRALQALIGGLLYRVLRGRSTVSAKSVVAVVLSAYLVFMSVYMIGAGALDPSQLTDSETYISYSRHFCYYLTAGVLGFSEASHYGIRDVGGGSYVEIFRPFVDLYRKLISGSNPVGLGSTREKGMQIDLTVNNGSTDSNVYTLFGTLYLYLGSFGLIAYVIVMALLCYALFLSAGWSKNEWLLVLYCYLGAQLLFGFFEFYFWHGDTYEIAVITGTLATMSFSNTRRFQLRSGPVYSH